MLLDTDALVDLIRKHPAATAWFAALATMPFVAGFAALELVQGCQSSSELRAVQRFLTAFEIVWPTRTDLTTALIEYMPLRLAHGIGLIDAVIAATAVGAQYTLVTFNVKHYRPIPRLKTLQPYQH